MSNEQMTDTQKKILEDFLVGSPQEEYKSYVEQKIEQALRFGDNENAEIYRKALELGLQTLNKLE